MPDRNKYIPTQYIADEVSKYYSMFDNQRKGFERRWFENNFFDDGYHFRYVSRQTGKIIDQSELSKELPVRSIPKASRQIRGVANLLTSIDPIAVVYPEKVTKYNYANPQDYMNAVKVSKELAKKSGHYIMEEFKKQELKQKLIQMLILSAKHYISFLEVWPDPVDEKINTGVFDAFEVYLSASVTEIYDSPAIIKAAPELIEKIKANELFDSAATERVIPDNKFASSETKQAYMATRFNARQGQESAATSILKEAFIKEYLNDENYEECKMLSERTGAMEGKKKGDVLIRHCYEASGEKLLDEYVDLDEYPFIDFRYEPGPVYGTPLIERFIPQNKSLDIAASRVERWMNTMVVGTWLTREGEDLQVTNISGGQKVSFKQTPPVQGQIASLPPTVFDFMGLMEKLIEEQGASTTALNKLPTGVKSGVAIESVKATEYDNLRIATDMFKLTTKRIAERMLDVVDRHFLNPQTVYYLEQGEPQYFDIIGQRGVNFRKQNNIPVREDVVPIKKDYYVDIQIESGMGYTMEGKKETVQQIITFMVQLAEKGLLTTDAIALVVRKALEAYQFGSTEEFMDAMKTGVQSAPLTEDQITQMKVAMLEAMKDAGVVGPDADQKLVDSTKVGTVEALRDTGMLNKPQENLDKEPSKSISFKDLPPEGKQQLAAQAGIQLDPNQIRHDELDNKIIDNSLKGGQNAPNQNR